MTQACKQRRAEIRSPSELFVDVTVSEKVSTKDGTACESAIEACVLRRMRQYSKRMRDSASVQPTLVTRPTKNNPKI
jgi:hypothetical protein